MQRDDQELSDNRTANAFIRRLYLAHLIDTGTNTVPALMSETGMPRRTIQQSISGMRELYIDCVFVGAKKNGSYQIKDWGAINRNWLKKNIQHINIALQ